MIFVHLLLTLAVLLFIPSQIFWLRQLRALGRKVIPSRSLRLWLAGLGMGLYVISLAMWLLPRSGIEPAHLTIRAVLLEAPFRWWVLSSLLGFVPIAAFYLCKYLGQGVIKVGSMLLPPSDPAKAAPAISSAPAAAL